ncbi:hypothetical protein NPIL_57611 [Nephila pilipes]|uniref:Uncharacterized protein n=1 Tax=Nephila pilipes TaxID=299642 RepID=A0A8X6MDT3_NEPPI|nr:hypothetical protein NPIL_57611 [Nephila pilipes]
MRSERNCVTDAAGSGRPMRLVHPKRAKGGLDLLLYLINQDTMQLRPSVYLRDMVDSPPICTALESRQILFVHYVILEK